MNMSMRDNEWMVDTHLHLDLYKDPRAIVTDLDELGLKAIAVTNAPFLFQPCVDLVGRKANIRVALGMHPELVSQYGHQVEMFRELLPRTSVVGEVGLDYHESDIHERRRQRRVFERILELSAAQATVMTIHSRQAIDDVLAMLGTNYPATPILHWFAGTVTQLERATESGCYFSVNLAMVRSRRNKARLKGIPESRLLIESDGPFVKRDGRPVLPADLVEIVKQLAYLYRKTVEEMARTIAENSRRILAGSWTSSTVI